MTGQRADLPIAERELDTHLQRTLRRTSVMRQGFYVVVLLVALAGQVSGAVEALRIPLIAAVPAVGALELGGIVVLANADVRRRLGERATASRLLSVAIAAGAVAFNWLAHDNHLLGGFFAGMSALGYLVWLMHTENQRRDRLRAKGDLPPTTPAYEIVDHWLRHPWLTHRAKSMAKADPRLGLYDSLAAARVEVRRERRQAAISKVLHRKIRAAVDPNTADIAIAVYDLDEIATRLADGADYDGLTALIAADLAPTRLGLEGTPAPTAPTTSGGPVDPLLAATSELPMVKAAGAPGAADRSAGFDPSGPTADLAVAAAEPAGTGSIGPGPADRGPTGPGSSGPGSAGPGTALGAGNGNGGNATGTGRGRAAVAPGSVLDPSLRRDLENALPRQRSGTAIPAQAATGEETSRRSRRGSPGRTVAPAVDETVAGPAGPPAAAGTPPRESPSLRRRVHTALDAHVRVGDQHDESSLVAIVSDVLQLSELERLTAATYVQSWAREGSSASAGTG